MSDKIRVKEVPENPVERSYTLDEYTGRLVIYLDGHWQFAEDVTKREYAEDIVKHFKKVSAMT
jgi:hypothetical protein